jgi:hypothetical protein
VLALANVLNLRSDKLSGLGACGFSLAFVLSYALQCFLFRHGVPFLSLVPFIHERNALKEATPSSPS